MVKPLTFKIELVGGPDDGAVFDTAHLPPWWDMLKKADRILCYAMGIEEEAVADRYWLTEHVTEKGHVLYYHEGLNGPETSCVGVTG